MSGFKEFGFFKRFLDPVTNGILVGFVDLFLAVCNSCRFQGDRFLLSIVSSILVGKGNYIGFLTTFLDAFYLFLEYIFTSVYCEVT